MDNNSLERVGLNSFQTLSTWFKSEYSVSKSLALGLFLNVFLTGFLTNSTNTTLNYNVHKFDFAVGMCVALGILSSGIFAKSFDRGIVILFRFMTIATLSCLLCLFGFDLKYGNVWVSNPLQQVASGTLSLTGAMLIYSVLIAAIAQGRQSNREVVITRLNLREHEQDYKNEIQKSSAAIVDNVKSRLKPAIDAISAQVTQLSTAPEYSAVVTNIVSTVNDVVLPLTWELQKSALDEISIIDQRNQRDLRMSRRQLRTQLFRTTLREIFIASRQGQIFVTPNATAGLFAFFAVPYGQYYFHSAGILEMLVTAGVMWCVLKTCSRLRFGFRFPVVVIASVLIAITSLSGALFVALVNIFEGADAIAYAIPIVFLAALVSFATATIQAAYIGHESAVAEAVRLNEKLSIFVSGLRQNSWNTKRKLARIVHGDIQSSLIAASMRLSAASTVNSQLLVEIQSAIELGLRKLRDVDQVVLSSFSDVERQFIEAWSDLLEISFDISDEDVKAIENNETLFSCLVEFCREGIGNAAKHAMANRARIQVASHGDTLMEVRIENAVGQGLKFDSSGFGGQLFDEITHEWNFAIQDQTATLWGKFSI